MSTTSKIAAAEQKLRDAEASRQAAARSEFLNRDKASYEVRLLKARWTSIIKSWSAPEATARRELQDAIEEEMDEALSRMNRHTNGEVDQDLIQRMAVRGA